MQNRIRTISSGLFFVLVLVPQLSGASIPDPASPQTVVERFHDSLLDVMKNAETLGYDGRLSQLAPSVKAAFDQPFMARKTMGRHWKTLDPRARDHWIQRFSYLTVSNYASRFTGYGGERFEVLSTKKARRDTVVVKTRIVLPHRENVKLDYRLHRTEDGWRIIDVFMNGTVSELALRRSEFSAAIKREGFEALLATLERKLAAMAKAGGGSGETLPARIAD